MGNQESYSDLPEKETRVSRRRNFLKALAGSAGGLALGGMLAASSASAQEQHSEWARQESRSLNIDDKMPSVVIFDPKKCQGCRICEVECAKYNERKTLESGEVVLGIGDTNKAKCWTHYYNPPVDVNNRCQQCSDRPCIEACPVHVDPKTGRRANRPTGLKALYVFERTQTLRVSKECIGCFSCVNTCAEKRNGSARADFTNMKATGFCTLCDGAPNCVEHCPRNALAHIPLDDFSVAGRYFAQKPEVVAQEVAKYWYGI